MITNPTDDEILNVLRGHGGRMTYVVKNVLRRTHHSVKTDFIRRRLMAMEKAGTVRRVRTDYIREICWDIATKETP